MSVKDVRAPLAVICTHSMSADARRSKEGDALLKVSTEMVPSEDAQARIAPSSCGAQETELTDALWRVCSLIFAQPAGVGPCAGCSFQMMTLPSYEHDARMCPNFGCAQATCHTGPVCLRARCIEEVRCVKVGWWSRGHAPFEDLPARLGCLSVYDVEHSDCPVGRACCKPLPVVVQLCIMLYVPDALLSTVSSLSRAT